MPKWNETWKSARNAAITWSLTARKRLNAFRDTDNQREVGNILSPLDPLKFKDSKKYKDRLAQAQKQTGEKDPLIVIHGQLKGRPVVVAAFNFEFMAGSMGSVVGEGFVRGANICLEQDIPLICFSASGGARMQESLLSLFQMSKTSAAFAKWPGRHTLHFCADRPDHGRGVRQPRHAGRYQYRRTGRINGFAGPRVIEQTVREKLPEGFQRSEFLLEHGAIDMIVDRREMRDKIADLLDLLLQGGETGNAAAETAVVPGGA